MIRGVLPSPLRFLTVDEVRTLHETSLDRYGGSAGTRDYGLLESAVSQPQQAFGGEYLHAAPFGMAAAYLFHLCQNHPFVDGNKRTARQPVAKVIRAASGHDPESRRRGRLR